MSGAATLTPYEIKRDERVARNKAILAKLIANNPLHQQMMMTTTTKKKNDDDDARTTPTKKKMKREKVNPEEVRRSGRIRKLPAPIYTTFELNEDLGDGTKTSGKKRKSTESRTVTAEELEQLEKKKQKNSS